MSKKKSYLKRINLPQEVKDGIVSRSSMLRGTIHTLSEEDLVQEGLLLVYSILKRKPDAPIPYLMKAINNRYSTIQDREVLRKTNTISYSDDPSIYLDKETYRDFQKKMKSGDTRSPSDTYVTNNTHGIVTAILTLKEEGHSFKDIAKWLRADVKTIRKMLRDYGKAKDSYM